MKITIKLNLTPEEVEAFLKECKINSAVGIAINNVDLTEVYKEMAKQIVSCPS